MPLTDFIRYLSTQASVSAAGARATMPFVSEDGRVFVHFAGLRLESHFVSIVAAATGDLRGHAAQLTAFGLARRTRVDAEAVFVLPGDDAEFIYLDRLVRTLHALNYLTFLDRHARGALLLRVHPRHVAAVPGDHGLAFEELLRGCGLLPPQITLEIECPAAGAGAHLCAALANYRARGYGLALRGAGGAIPDLALVRAARPDIVKFDAATLPPAADLHDALQTLRGLGVQSLIEGLATASFRRDALAAGFDLVQARVPARRLLQAPRSVAAIRTGLAA